MKRFLVVLLSVGFVMAFSIPAHAVDVKFSGSYYAQGWYVNNHELQDNNDSRAFISQRLRLQTVFQVADGLSLTTRCDILEKKWGDQRWKGGFQDNRNRLNDPTGDNASVRVQENIEFERAYVTFATGIGTFNVGYQQGSSQFGTSFLDSDESIARIVFARSFSPTTLILSYEKFNEYMGTSSTYSYGDNNKDADDNAYAIGGISKFQGGEAGLIYKFIDLSSPRPTSSYRSRLHVLDGYVKKTAGPLYVEAEAYYIGGKMMEYENSVTTPDVDAESYGGYVKAQMDQGAGYSGVMFVYMRGDDPGTTDKKEGGFMSTLNWGENFNPCLILWNFAYNQTWVGNLTGNAGSANAITGYMDNAIFGQIYGGFKPTPKLHLKAAVSYAKADKKPAGFVDDEYGTEVDVTASYKIYDNLEYMVGAAYLWAGDYFKGTSSSNKIDDNYILTHKLTLTF